MKRFLIGVAITFLLTASVSAQLIDGIIVDQNGNGLWNLKLQLYTSQKSYTAISGGGGYFAFSIITSVTDEQLPIGYAVSDNYPNPFNPKTRINISLPKAGVLKINIFNLLGQQVKEVPERNFSAGVNYIDLELQGLPNGFYIAQIIIDGKFRITKKMMLIYGSQHLASSTIINEAGFKKILDQNNSKSGIKIDSLVVTGKSIAKKIFTNLPDLTGSSLNLGNLVAETYAAIPCPGIPEINYAGKIYNTVQIGSQCWLKENIDIGIMIPGLQKQTDNGIIEKYCLNDSPDSCIKYGGLYQWAETVQYKNGATDTTIQNPPFSGNVQGICPPGWHIPDLFEYGSLRGTVSNKGNSLLEIGQRNGTNISGFSALLTGYREYNGNFYPSNQIAFFRSSSEYSNNTSFSPCLDYTIGDVFMNRAFKTYGFSVRCIKDELINVQACPGTSTVTDTRDNKVKVYNTVLIGNQCWIKENLDVGEMITGSRDQSNNNIIEKYCYNNSLDSCKKYGGLYLWSEAIQYKNGDYNTIIQGICPVGWHIPTE